MISTERKGAEQELTPTVTVNGDGIRANEGIVF
jgi:hypothetical protein